MNAPPTPMLRVSAVTHAVCAAARNRTGSTRPGRDLPRKWCRRSWRGTSIGDQPKHDDTPITNRLSDALYRRGLGLYNLRPVVKVHLIGIGGTGMGAVAGLLADAGHEVRGSDAAVYPPMSEQLAALGVPVMMPYSPDNLAWQPDLVVVGNVHGRDHIEVVAAQQRGIPLTSFPAVIGERLLDDKHAIVVCGTHGKTTTTSLIAHILLEAGLDPSLFVGGVPVTLGRGYRLGKGADFVIEGDEYDTAFFDKGPKFLHYRPQSVVLTSVELDHVDIFASFEAVREVFRKLVTAIPATGLLVVCADEPEALAVAR